MQKSIGFLLILLFFGATVSEAYSQLKTPLIIQSGMVIQREMDIPIWGEGSKNKKVYVELNGVTDSSIVDTDGSWIVSLPSMAAGGPYELKIESEDQELVYTEVFIGDVWLASGQSNMQMELGISDPPDAEIDPNDNHEIRQFMVNRSLKNNASEELTAGSAWTPATKENIGNYTAVGFYFAKYLYADLGVPIGIINSSYGGARIETWMSQGMLGFDERDIVFGDGSNFLQPTLAYNAMLHGLRNVPVKGFIWYQGESNAGSREDAILYSSLFKEMIISWRELWGLGDLPFLWVQLPNFNTEGNESTPGSWDAWPLIRESQNSALALSNTGEATSIDVGDLNIHPTNKQPVGKRLSLVARALVYNDTVEYSGPRYKSHRKLANGKIEISFDHLGGGLIAKNSDANLLKWFSIVRSNGALVRADAVIENDKVIVWNDAVSDPLAIRYAWETNPAGVNFYNEAGLPAAPFYIYVDEKGLSIDTYVAERTSIDRGESSILRWEAFGSDSVLFNGSPVDQKSAMRVWPLMDSVFTLIVIDQADQETSVSKSITINVRQPIPIIEINSTSADIIPMDSSAIVSAAVSREGGAPIEKVEFFLNEQLLYTDTEVPYELEWLADSTGLYTITAKVYNELNISTGSNSLTYNVKDLEFIRYEAEDAVYKPGGRIKSSPEASNELYLDLMTNWTLSFDSVLVDTIGAHLLYIRYLLNYGSPRIQNLLVNDSLITNVMFTSPDLISWQDYVVTIPLDSGTNKISIEGLWDYMSFDYISVGKEKIVSVVDTSTIDTSVTDLILKYSAEEIQLLSYPNPFSTISFIEFTIPAYEHIELSVVDLSGREIAILAKGIIKPGRHKFRFAPISDESGIYIIRLSYKGDLFYRKLVKSGG